MRYIGPFYLAVILAALLFGSAVLRPGIDAIGSIEGWLFPVVSEVVLSDPRPAPPPAYRHAWHGEAEKLRECSFVGMEWFLGSRNGLRASVVSGFTDPPEVRGQGGLVFSGILVSLDPAEIEASHADVIHQCPWRPWLTRTPFYR